MYKFQKTSRSLLRRRFTMEQLERRSMLASDLTCFHNIEMPEDANGSGDVTPLDALVVINRLNSTIASSTATTDTVMTDVDADATTSPLDALIVINYLNRYHNGVAGVSSLSPATRIAQIEKLISSGSLASTFTLDDAIDVIATLRSGGHPELGEHCLTVETFTKKLTNASVSQDTITTITKEITDASTAGTPLTFTQIKTRLTELGVDVASIFQQETHPHNNTEHSDRFVQRLTQQLKDAGVSADTITTIVKEVNDAVTAGTPLTLTQLKTRLTELGVDVSLLALGTRGHHSRRG